MVAQSLSPRGRHLPVEGEAKLANKAGNVLSRHDRDRTTSMEARIARVAQLQLELQYMQAEHQQSMNQDDDGRTTH